MEDNMKMLLFGTVALTLMSVFAPPVYAQSDDKGREQAFASLYLEACFNKHSDFDAVSAMAISNHWISVDPVTTPFKVQK
jgi:hypothetical protein